MNRNRDERRFLEGFATAPGVRAGLPRAAVLLARTACPDADPDRVEARLVALGRDLRRRAPRARSAEARARALADLLAGERRLRGNRERYDDPRNSCLECVLDRGLGIPLALSLVWMAAGRRAGWTVEGIGLPGHFVVRVVGEDDRGVLADPFHGGGTLTRAGARKLLLALHGRPVRLRPADLEPMHPRDILLRMLRNLRSSYRKAGDRERALAVAEDMLLLAPDLPEALRDRGLLRLEGGDRHGGVADLRAFLLGSPPGPGAEAAYRLVSVLTDDAEMPN